ncbi:MAG TPA: RusA family crossover junction endodeoxyribonuclease [Thermomicrobiales bacterium]|nr:RusA family crossover junction endodeoxyribonuclease [Thermomicrobiales bacterium]
MSELTIDVPMDPPAILLPNAKRNAHWARINQATQEYRECAKYAALNARPRRWQPFAGPVALHIHIGWGRRRRRIDLDAAGSGAKAALDGLVDAHILIDDRLVVDLRVTQEKAVDGNGFTRFVIQETQA